MPVDFAKNGKVAGKIAGKGVLEIGSGEFLGEVGVNQRLDALHVVLFHQLEDFSDVLFADEDRAALKCGGELLVGSDEAREREPERVEAALQAFHEEDFHKPRKVVLRGNVAFRALAFVVGKWTVTGVSEVTGKSFNGMGEDAVFVLAELVEERLGRRDFGKA